MGLAVLREQLDSMVLEASPSINDLRFHGSRTGSAEPAGLGLRRAGKSGGGPEAILT